MCAILIFFVFYCSFITGNPFQGQSFYVNPAFQSELMSSIKTSSGKTKENLLSIYNQSSAFWIDTMDKISTATISLKYILQDSSRYAPPRLIVIIIYDLPNRDCHARASNGEICCNSNVLLFLPPLHIFTSSYSLLLLIIIDVVLCIDSFSLMALVIITLVAMGVAQV